MEFVTAALMNATLHATKAQIDPRVISKNVRALRLLIADDLEVLLRDPAMRSGLPENLGFEVAKPWKSSCLLLGDRKQPSAHRHDAGVGRTAGEERCGDSQRRYGNFHVQHPL